MIIDFHTHCFPDNLAVKAMTQLKRRSGIIHTFHDGTVDGLLNAQTKGGVDLSVVLNIATNPKQMKNVNDFAISLLDKKGIIPFGSIHPDSHDVFAEIERIKNSGIKGIKLHPDYQNFFADDEKMFPIYEKIGKEGLITVFHCGIDMGYPYPVHGNAQRLGKVLDYFGGAPVVAAHMGGICDFENVMKYLVGKDVYLDTAYCVGTLPPASAKEIIASHGLKKILFGTDMPWNSPPDAIETVRQWVPGKESQDAILGLNAAELLNLE